MSEPWTDGQAFAEIERLQQLHAVREAELGGVKYSIFNVRQEIAGHRLYPQTDRVRREIARHERNLDDLYLRAASLTTEVRNLADRIARLRQEVALGR